MERTQYIKLAGKNYPLRFSLGASIELSKKYGSIEKMGEVIAGSGEVASMESAASILEVLIAQGCAYKNLFEKGIPAPEDAPVENGKYVPIDMETICIAADLYDIGEISKKIMLAIGRGTREEIKTEENDDGKNAEAT